MGSPQEAILVTGGAGYIGSATVDWLIRSGERVVVIDDLKRGHRENLPVEVPLYAGSVGEKDLVRHVLGTHKIDSCIHLAGLAYVSESVREPARYYQNNVVEGIAMLDALVEGNVRSIVFSSSCSTYGEAQTPLISEDHPQRPLSPYGWSKLFFEHALSSYGVAYGTRHVVLRYFNAAGATETHGEDHDPEPHLIPNVLSAAADPAQEVVVCGSDFPTPDGSPVRDYIHIADLARAHALAIRHLRAGKDSACLNLATGTGYSVLEVIEAARRITGRPIRSRVGPRREGDAPSLVARADLAKDVLGWAPEHSSIDEILRSAWQWMQRRP